MSLDQWGDYQHNTGLVSRMPTTYEREQSIRDRYINIACKVIIVGCGLVLAAVVAAGS